ncbi:MAG: protein kinase domain-containing protein [Isosphaeraceae bacterium]
MSTSETQDQKDREHKDEREQDPEGAPSAVRDPLGPILESFVARFRKGERPSLREYTGRYPELADEIRELFPAVVEIEQLGSLGGAAAPPGAKGARPGDPRPAQGARAATAAYDPAGGLAATAGGKTGPGPQQLGDYRILGCIGEGGMGVVYEAVRESLKSRVALKVMHPRFRDSAGYIRRFHNEARSAAQLHHTNIVSVFDYGEHEGVCYYAMQHIAGHSLDQILSDVRRLRSNQGQDNAAAAAAGPHPHTKAPPPPPPAPAAAVDEAAQTAAADDPLLRTVTHGLLTGQFAKGGGEALELEPTPHPVTEPITPRMRVATAMSHDLGFELGRTQAPAPSSARDEARTPADPAPGSSSSSLAGQGDDHYHREVARLGAQVADALAYAHKRGVLHRDIKPSNLLLDAVGNVWVTDFGLAKFEDAEDLSQSQDLVGTMRYMAPERFRGVSDRRCDIYALGATLYELLTLRPLFESADRLRLIDQVVHEPPAPPRQLDGRIPRDLETIVQKALAKDPTDRFATADELAAELRRFLENRPIRSRPIPAYERLWRWCKRNPGLAFLNALAATLTTITAIVSTAAAWIYYGQRNELRFEHGLTRASLARAEHAEHDARLALGRSLVSEGAALERTGLIGQRFESLDRLARAAQVLGADSEGRRRLPEIRNHAIAALGLVDLRMRRQRDRGDVFEITVDAALNRYALMERSGEVVVRRLDDDRDLVRLPGPDRRDYWHAHAVFSPDGELLAAVYVQGSGGSLMRIWHPEQRKLIGSLPGRGRPVFHPDGRRLLFCAVEGGVGVWNRDEPRAVRRLPLEFTPSYVVPDPEGRRLAINSADDGKPRVAIVDLESGRVLADMRSQVGNGAMAWSADGQLLAVGGRRTNGGRVYVWSVRRGTLASVLEGHSAEIIGAMFAHSGYLLATSSWDGTTRLWDAASGEALAMAPGSVAGEFAPDDRRLPFDVGGKVGVWDVATAAECRTLHPAMLGNRTLAQDVTEVLCADVSPDGRLVATGGGDGVRLWEAETGRELPQLNSSGCETVLFQPDGQSLISSGIWGLYRWPIRPDPKRGPDAISIGPPGLLRETAGAGRAAAWLPDHRTLALVDNADARVLLIDSGQSNRAWSRARALHSGGNRRMTSIAVSPDGRWLAVGGWKEAGVRVWDLQGLRLERILRPKDVVGDLVFFIAFSADGRWLVSNTQPDGAPKSCRFWHVGTWEPGLRIDHERHGNANRAPAFTRDGRMMALGIAPDQVLLADSATGGELARLTTLQSVTPTPLVFSPDGTKLVASTNQKTALVWDLRQVRDQLRPMGLDWDAPPYPPAAAPSGTTAPGVAGLAALKAGSTAATRTPESESAGTKLPAIRSVRVIGDVIEPNARRAAELAEMNRRLAAAPDDAEALIHRGWLFTREKKWPGAIADLEQRLRLRPGDADAFWLLGEAYQETGNLAKALAAFSRLLERAPEDRDARLERGLLALALDQPGLAADDFSRVLAAEPDRDGARYRRALASIRLRRHREALFDLDLLIPKFPDDYVLYELRGTVGAALGKNDQARADREHAGRLLPKDAMALNRRAWILATSRITQRDPDRAVALAQRAVALAPGQQLTLNTLGVALYRAGQFAKAISVLKRSLTAGKGQFAAFDLFFLAMAHQKLGHASQARDCFYRAVRWWGEHKNLPAQYVPELTGFRAEAEAALAGARAELPGEVFAPE